MASFPGPGGPGGGMPGGMPGGGAPPMSPTGGDPAQMLAQLIRKKGGGKHGKNTKGKKGKRK